MKLLDLFSCEGVGALGYARAGFEVVAVDLRPMPANPFDFYLADALGVLTDPTLHERFDAIHASPPCQSETSLRHLSGNEHPNLLGPTLEALRAQPLPWIVENVEDTDQMPGALTLCGTHFDLSVDCSDGRRRWLKRHRKFLASFPLEAPTTPCACRDGRPIVGVYGMGGGGPMTRGYKARAGEDRDAIGAPHATRYGLSQSIPPAYTEFLGRQLAAHLLELTA